jgi:hypothetical protein
MLPTTCPSSTIVRRDHGVVREDLRPVRIMGCAVAAGKRRHRARHRIVLLFEEDRDVVRLNLSKLCDARSQSKVPTGGRARG